eukprot:CAMPEP_0206330272 /NCGR_PEP_ID=MMETSP0106_2-20121207/23635_1 /ASSEMBLY_ACC=CAM_ASM_000206 /TAXON_ID=81532 /ORGANISM="Acanthoeca-like sp., Strain 10tr" /LENGTH=30 /DNA_ID= /DNA_START= /DNA_END= /DNA_ORIENTATION=
MSLSPVCRREWAPNSQGVSLRSCGYQLARD